MKKNLGGGSVIQVITYVFVMDPLPSFQISQGIIYKSTRFNVFPFVIPDAVLQCHKDTTE
jgi:hypothetical protein